MKVFFPLFTVTKKVRRSPGTRVRECPGTSAHPRWPLIKWLRAVLPCFGAMMSVRRGTTRSASKRGAALRTVWADRSGACSPRTTLNGSLRGSAGREGASGSVLGRQGGLAVPVLGQGHGEWWLGWGYSQPLVQAVRGCCSVSLRHFLLYVDLLALFALGKLDTSPLPSYLSALVRSSFRLKTFLLCNRDVYAQCKLCIFQLDAGYGAEAAKSGFCLFSGHFRAPPGRLELSASFRSLDGEEFFAFEGSLANWSLHFQPVSCACG